MHSDKVPLKIDQELEHDTLVDCEQGSQSLELKTLVVSSTEPSDIQVEVSDDNGSDLSAASLDPDLNELVDNLLE
jgi:hypothetical protein